MKKYFSLIFFCFLSCALFSQSFEDALRYSQSITFGTARSLSMSGAFGSLGADMSCGSINPAGLALFNSYNASVSLLYGDSDSESEYFGTKHQSDIKYLSIPNMGMIWSMPSTSTDIKRWNVGFTYNELNNFKFNDHINGFNTQSSLINVFHDYATGFAINDLNPFYESLAFWTDLIDLSDNTIDTNNNWYMYDNGNYVSRLNSPGSNQTLYRESSGNLGEFVFSLSNSYLDRVYFGLGLGLLILEYQQVDSYHENNFLDSLSSLNDFSFNNKLETSGSGVNLKIGSILRLTDNLRLGVSYHSKTYYELEDIWESNITANFDNASYNDYSPLGYYNYKLRTPSKLIASASFVNKKMILSFDIESMNYSNSSLHDDYDSFLYENDSISTYLTNAINTKFGVEFNIKGFKIRGGFANYGNPYKYNESHNNSNYSVGIGFNSKLKYIDIAYVNRFKSSIVYPYNNNYTNPADLTRNTQDIILTIGWRMPNRKIY